MQINPDSAAEMMMVAELLPGKMCKEEGEITSLIAISRRLNHEEYKQDAIKRKEACFMNFIGLDIFNHRRHNKLENLVSHLHMRLCQLIVFSQFSVRDTADYCPLVSLQTLHQ